jgi:hypothetical protein
MIRKILKCDETFNGCFMAVNKLNDNQKCNRIIAKTRRKMGECCF